jgi:hypothetical protein
LNLINFNPASCTCTSLLPLAATVQEGASIKTTEVVPFDEGSLPTTAADVESTTDTPYKERLWEVIKTFWPLGFIAFGGPQAHVAILRNHLVVGLERIPSRKLSRQELTTLLHLLQTVAPALYFNPAPHRNQTLTGPTQLDV